MPPMFPDHAPEDPRKTEVPFRGGQKMATTGEARRRVPGRTPGGAQHQVIDS